MTKTRHIAPRLLVVGGLSLLIFVGPDCASARPARPSFRVERESSRAVFLSAPKVKVQGESLRISGWLDRGPDYDTREKGHLDVFLLSADGRELESAAVEYSPHPIPRGWGARGGTGYEVRFNKVPLSTAIIRVKYHAAATQGCPLRKNAPVVR